MMLITQAKVGTLHNEVLAMQAAAHEAGWEVVGAPSGWRLPEHVVSSEAKGVPYGTQTFCEVIAQQMNWTLRQNSFDWLAKVPKSFLKRQVDFMTLKEAKQLTQVRFIKPADDKVFEAKVYQPGEFQPHELIPQDTPVLVSEPVQFDVEYRTFMNGFSVKTWSNYLFYGEINDPRFHHMVNMNHQHPVDFVNELMLKSAIPCEPCVIDVGLIRGRGMAVIECNQAWASGLYGCDPGSALSVLEVACD